MNTLAVIDNLNDWINSSKKKKTHVTKVDEKKNEKV